MKRLYSEESFDTVFESVDLTRKMLDELKRALLASEDAFNPFPTTSATLYATGRILEGGDSLPEAVSGKEQDAAEGSGPGRDAGMGRR